MIESKDISVVVQGGINEYTKDALNSIREFLPDSKIILSTWKNSDILGLHYDYIIFSDDPGGIVIDDFSGTVNNINRQIRSTKAGLGLVKSKYCFKFRTDLILNNSEFLKYFDCFDVKNPSLHFKNRVLICNYYTRNPRVIPLPFHISDWIMFGNTEDIMLYFDLEEESKEELRWFKIHKKTQNGFYTNLLTRYVPEQYLCINFANKFYNFNCDSFYDANIENIHITEEILAMDFVVLDYKTQFNISFNKYNPNRYIEKFTLISHKNWLFLYNNKNRKKNNFKWYIYCKIKQYILMIRKVSLIILGILKIKEFAKKIMTRIIK